MKKTQYILTILIIPLFVSLSACAKSIPNQPIAPPILVADGHPRILMLKGEEDAIKQSIATNPTWKRMNDAILNECNKMLMTQPVERVLIGRRLLDKSREALRRIFYLSYAYRVTGEKSYAQRAEKEMLSVSMFSDWNPSHFLDVAEMTMAMAIGYDWLYDELSEASRLTIREAIVGKGLNQSMDSKNNSFLKANHNWNQVCNAGMAFGAVALQEDYPELSNQIIERAISTIHLPMNEYNPNGAYPEGYNYWGYGTSFNVMFISLIEKAFGKDYDLSTSPGFLKTAQFLQNMTGAVGSCFNWGDCGIGAGLSPAMFWFAKKTNDPSLLWVEKKYLETDLSKYINNRLLPAILIWGRELPINQISKPSSNFYIGEGANPVCLMRTSWSDSNAIYVGYKAGSSSVNHGHMDVGSFVMESDGVRWASDFGMQDYESLESKGIALFGRTQDAQRWTVFRLNNYVHNTLTIDNQLQLVKGYAKIDQSSSSPDWMFAQSDLSSVYENQLAAARRGVGIADQKYVVVRDEVTATSKGCTLRWTMMTTAEVKINSDNSITLTKEGKSLQLKVVSPVKVRMASWSTEPTTSYDAPNPGTTLIGFETDILANEQKAIEVLLIPGSSSQVIPVTGKSLSNW